MEHGPLPPHERTWRHPSELAAEEHAVARSETSPATTRVFAFTTGTLGLLAVGLLMLAVTPSGSTAPVAISATTTPAAPAGTVSAIATGSSDRAPIGLRGAPEALATPIGDGRYAVITAADLTATAGVVGVGEEVEVAVPSGRLHDARVVGRSGETVLVELERTEPAVEVADRRPTGDEIVTVLAEPPVTIVFDDLAQLQVEEGTAVLDDDGDLVGLCSQDRGDSMRLVTVSVSMLDDTTGEDTTGEADRGTVSDVPVGATSGG